LMSTELFSNCRSRDGGVALMKPTWTARRRRHRPSEWTHPAPMILGSFPVYKAGDQTCAAVWTESREEMLRRGGWMKSTIGFARASGARYKMPRPKNVLHRAKTYNGRHRAPARVDAALAVIPADILPLKIVAILLVAVKSSSSQVTRGCCCYGRPKTGMPRGYLKPAVRRRDAAVVHVVLLVRHDNRDGGMVANPTSSWKGGEGC